MNNINDFIKNNSFDFSPNRISKSELIQICKDNNIVLGEQLTQYILLYGFLATGAIEFYGINATQGNNSDMIKQTVYLNKYFPETKGLVAFENCGEGLYVLIDQNDNVYKLNTEISLSPTSSEIKLFDYIMKRSKDANF